MVAKSRAKLPSVFSEPVEDSGAGKVAEEPQEPQVIPPVAVGAEQVQIVRFPDVLEIP